MLLQLNGIARVNTRTDFFFGGQIGDFLYKSYDGADCTFYSLGDGFRTGSICTETDKISNSFALGLQTGFSVRLHSHASLRLELAWLHAEAPSSAGDWMTATHYIQALATLCLVF
jgi:hypothetical protein